MFRHELPMWPWWSGAAAPDGVPHERWVRSLNPLTRLTPAALQAYAAAMADDAWRGHYEFTLVTALREAGLVIEDLGGEGSFVPPGRERAVYVGKSPAGRPKDLTFGFRPVREHYFHEVPESFEQPGLLYHPVTPGVAAWNRTTMNRRDCPGQACGADCSARAARCRRRLTCRRWRTLCTATGSTAAPRSSSTSRNARVRACSRGGLIARSIRRRRRSR